MEELLKKGDEQAPAAPGPVDEQKEKEEETKDAEGSRKEPGNGTQEVPERVKSHTVLMAGVYVGGCKVLARANVALAAGGDEGVTLTLQIRSDDEAISELISSSVG